MIRQTSYVVAFCAIFVATLLGAAPEASALRNNLNLIPPAHTHFGIAGVKGQTLRVRLFRTRVDTYVYLNNSIVTINEIASGGPPLFDGTEAGRPFDETFPNGAYELIEANGASLLAAKGCLQGKAVGNAGWDNGKMYCDKASISGIEISTYDGTDLISVDPAIAVPVVSRCIMRNQPCAYSCLGDELTCCDQTPPGCYAVTGEQICGVDTCLP